MISGECLCDEDSAENLTYNNSCSGPPIDDISDFVKQLSHYKCRVVKLTREQIERSVLNQSHLLSQINESAQCNNEETTRREKREANYESPIVESKATETLEVINEGSYKFLTIFKKMIFVILIFLMVAWLLLFSFAKSCGKGGVCLPFASGCKMRARIF